MSTNEIFQLNADEKAVILKSLQDTSHAIGHFHQLISKDTLTEKMKETLGQLIEFRMAELSESIGFDSLSAEKVEQKYAEIRQANQKICELEGKLGKTNPIEGLKEQLEGLAQNFQTWWRQDGFKYISNMSFTQYGRFEAELGFSFQRSYLFMSKTPVSDRQTQKEWEQSLLDKGYQIYFSEHDNNKELIDCPENRGLLIKLVKERFPSAVIEGIHTRIIHDAPGYLFAIQSMKVDISNLKELKDLEDYFGRDEGEE